MALQIIENCELQPRKRHSTPVNHRFVCFAVEDDNANRRSTLTFPNEIVATYEYDNANRLTSITYSLSGNTLGDLAYAYDRRGNRTSVGGSWARTSLPAALTSAAYDAANRIATWGGTSFAYDLNGNVTSDGSTAYTWNVRNQLIGLSGGASAGFAYDGIGRRRGKTIDSATTNFLYDGLSIVQELTGGGVPTANLLSLGLDETLSRTDVTGASTLLVDALGSTLAQTDSAATVQTSYTYDPFGMTTMSGAPSSNATQFTGRENDGTGLYYYRARYYQPGLSRFLSEDPIGFSGDDVNLYAYVGNRPSGATDPLGLWVPAFHRDMTRDVAKACGMPDADAQRLGDADRGVDFSWGP